MRIQDRIMDQKYDIPLYKKLPILAPGYQAKEIESY